MEECTQTTPPKCVENFRVVIETRELNALEVEWTTISNLDYQLQYRVYGSGDSFTPTGDRFEFKNYGNRGALEKVRGLDSA